MKILTRAMGILFVSLSSSFSYWFILHTTDFNHLEQINSSTLITLAVRYDAPSPYYIYRYDSPTSYRANQVNMTPPVGKEMQWLSILTTAISTGQDLMVSGDWDSVYQVVNADAVHGIGRLSLGR